MENDFVTRLEQNPLAQDVTWTYIRRSENVLDIFWTS